MIGNCSVCVRIACKTVLECNKIKRRKEKNLCHRYDDPVMFVINSEKEHHFPRQLDASFVLLIILHM